ncbi:MAG: hypothetical protein IJ744_07615 [Lachnospiraceae bacterium]|nr:hypothetical protein [Lachnospiraceae bacterium]
MFDVIFDYLKRLVKSRLIFVVIIYGVLFGMLIHSIFSLQIQNRQVYEQVDAQTKEVTRELKATRGKIYDRNGVLLATNELCYNITYSDTGELKSAEQINQMFYRLLKLLDQYDCKLETTFPIRQNDKGELEFSVSGSTLTRFLKDAYSTENLSEEQANADAQTVYEFLSYDKSVNSPRFLIPDTYSVEDTLRILSIRFTLFINRYSKQTTEIAIASNVSMEAVAAFSEHSPELPGVSISQETRRIYEHSEAIAHIVGYTGLITQDQLEEKNASGDTYYSASDQIGKTGIEADMEEELRGQKGLQTITYDENGKVISNVITKEPVPGNDIYLTIDVELTEQLYTVLENHLAGILLDKIHSGSDHGSMGESSGDITIPIYDVYNALIENNVIDIRHFNAEDASDLERSVYAMHVSRKEEVLAELKKYLAQNAIVTGSELDETMAGYLSHVYDALLEDGVLDSEALDRNDSVYRNYRNGKIGLNQFLTYAFSKSWIKLGKLHVESGAYYDTGELYELLMDYTWNLLENDSAFTKMIYADLIYSYRLSGKSICLLLFEQNVLTNAEEEAQIRGDLLSPYGFLTQKIRSLEITPADLALEPCSGAIILTDANSGEVRVMVSYPTYDLNHMANSVDTAYYAKMYDNQSAPFYNRATYTRLAPGSTFKIVSTVAALNEGVVSTSETVEDQVIFTNVNPSPRCWISPYSHGAVNVTTAIEVSCNYFFYEMAYRLGSKQSGTFNDARGLQALNRYAKMFCLDQKTGVEIGEIEPKISDDDAIRSAIGQGTNAFAPIQLSRYVTTIANGGKVFALTMVMQVNDNEGHTIYRHEPDVVNETSEISGSTWNVIHTGMYRVVNAGSVRELFSDLNSAGITIAGKTGTAQQNDYHPNHSWFISYSPYQAPEITSTILIPNGYGSTNAVELSADVYKVYYQTSEYEALLTHEAIAPKSNATTD